MHFKLPGSPNWKRLQSRFLKQVIGFLILAAFWVAVLGLGAAKNQASPATGENLVIQGTLVCLDKGLRETPCGVKNAAFGLKTAEGQRYPLLNQENVQALFVEKRLGTREFRLTLKKEPNSPFYNLVKSQLVRNGKLYDFHYFCEVCTITTYAPGLCMCCRQETEYLESPAKE